MLLHHAKCMHIKPSTQENKLNFHNGFAQLTSNITYWITKHITTEQDIELFTSPMIFLYGSWCSLKFN